jgi:hypothetical protein
VWLRSIDKARQQSKDLSNWDAFVHDLFDLHEGKFASAVEREAEVMLGVTH